MYSVKQCDADTDYVCFFYQMFFVDLTLLSRFLDIYIGSNFRMEVISDGVHDLYIMLVTSKDVDIFLSKVYWIYNQTLYIIFHSVALLELKE